MFLGWIFFVSLKNFRIAKFKDEITKEKENKQIPRPFTYFLHLEFKNNSGKNYNQIALAKICIWDMVFDQKIAHLV